MWAFVVTLGPDSTLTDASFEPTALKRQQLNVIRIILPENGLTLPFNFPCQVFPEALKLLCFPWSLASMRAAQHSQWYHPEARGFKRVWTFDSIPEWIPQLPCDPRRLSRNSGAVWRGIPPGVRRHCHERPLHSDKSHIFFYLTKSLWNSIWTIYDQYSGIHVGLWGVVWVKLFKPHAFNNILMTDKWMTSTLFVAKGEPGAFSSVCSGLVLCLYTFCQVFLSRYSSYTLSEVGQS